MKFSLSVATACLASAAIATDTVLTVQKLVDRVKTVELQRNLYNLNQIAKKNGGNRAFGWPGYAASGDYILERAVTRFGPNFKTYKQFFNHTYEETRNISLTGPDGESVFVVSSQYNTPTALPGGVFGELVDTPVDDTRGSGCFQDQWEGINVVGKIALVKRGACAIADKLKLAKNNGALAVILINNAPTDTIIGATLQATNIGLIVPVGTVRQATGLAWKARLAAGEKLSVRLVIDGFLEIRETFNIISETVEGDPNNVIMIGAHLDSVQAGPGINDDGSGTSALLEIMTAIRYYKGYKNKIRFGWWGAEESGLVGSTFYVNTLPEADLDKIRFYFNYDMIGSINPQYAVYEGTNPADKYGSQGLIDFLKSNGKDAFAAPFGTSSDYLAFINAGVPSSGIFTGAGDPFDPCYHLLCDTTANINAEAFTLNAKAAAFQVGTFALSDLAGLAPRAKSTVNPRSRTEQRNQLDKMRREFEHAIEHTHSCDNHAKIVV